jgi:salicylate hydroxylase
MSRLSSWDQLPQLVEAFQELREGRCRVVHEQELMGSQLVWLPPGPHRDERDRSLRAMVSLGLQGWDEDKMRLQWEELREVHGYSAREATEDWWVSWGILRERCLSASLPPSTFEQVNGRGQKIEVAHDVLLH